MWRLSVLPVPSRGEVLPLVKAALQHRRRQLVCSTSEPPDLLEPTSYGAHSVAQATDACAADPQTDHTPGRKDAVTLLLASTGQASELNPQPRSPPPPAPKALDHTCGRGDIHHGARASRKNKPCSCSRPQAPLDNAADLGATAADLQLSFFPAVDRLGTINCYFCERFDRAGFAVRAGVVAVSACLPPGISGRGAKPWSTLLE